MQLDARKPRRGCDARILTNDRIEYRDQLRRKMIAAGADLRDYGPAIDAQNPDGNFGKGGTIGE